MRIPNHEATVNSSVVVIVAVVVLEEDSDDSLVIPMTEEMTGRKKQRVLTTLFSFSQDGWRGHKKSIG